MVFQQFTLFPTMTAESKRVAIARALAMNPGIMLFDEPTDPELVGEVLAVERGDAREVLANPREKRTREFLERVL